MVRNGTHRRGIVTIVLSARNHVRLVRELDQGLTAQPRPSVQAVAIALFIALLGLAMAIYLVAVQGSAGSTLGSNSEAVMASTPISGIVSLPSNHSADQTVEKLKNILQSKGVALFAMVDHSGEAAKVGMKMRPTKLLIFGNPKAGTPLMLAAPSTAIDLPLKILIWEDAQGKAWVSYNSPAYLQQRHQFPPDLLKNVEVVEMLATKAVE